MDPTHAAHDRVERLAVVVLLGLAGCGLVIATTSPAEPFTTTRTLGALFGVFLTFVAIAGAVDTFGSP